VNKASASKNQMWWVKFEELGKAYGPGFGRIGGGSDGRMKISFLDMNRDGIKGLDKNLQRGCSPTLRMANLLKRICVTDP
jgi:hypothetical protein